MGEKEYLSLLCTGYRQAGNMTSPGFYYIRSTSAEIKLLLDRIHGAVCHFWWNNDRLYKLHLKVTGTDSVGTAGHSSCCRLDRSPSAQSVCQPEQTEKKKVDDEARQICKTLNLYAIIIYSASSRSALPLAALTKQQSHAGDHHRTIASCNWIKM